MIAELPNGWDVETVSVAGTDWVTVHLDGWVVAEYRRGGQAWVSTRRPRVELPESVLASLPAGIREDP